MKCSTGVRLSQLEILNVKSDQMSHDCTDLPAHTPFTNTIKHFYFFLDISV